MIPPDPADTAAAAHAAADAIADIRAAMACLLALSAGGQLDHASVLAAVNAVDANLTLLAAASAPDVVELPVLSLAEVAARVRIRDAVRPRFTVVGSSVRCCEGGAA